jgi:hypothetical protein
MGHSIARWGAGCAGVLAGLALAATPALAHSRARHSFEPRGVAGADGVLHAKVVSDAASSAYFGGYDVVPALGISSDGSTFKMPTFKCKDASVYQLDGLGEWVNNADGDFYQAGGDTDAFAVASIFCNFGVPTYGIAAYTAGGGEFDPTTDVNPGDLIQTRVEELPSGDAVANVTDLTTGQSANSEGASLGDETQVYEGLVPDVLDETLQSSNSIPKFKSVMFTRSQVGSVPLAQVGPTATDLAQNGPVMVAPSAIAAKTPGRFTITEESTQ